MTGSEQIDPNSFWVEFGEYLRSFYADLSPSTDLGDFRGSNFWWRASEGSLHLTGDESRRYHQLLQTCCEQLAPDADISEAAFDSALKDAIFWWPTYRKVELAILRFASEKRSMSSEPSLRVQGTDTSAG